MRKLRELTRPYGSATDDSYFEVLGTMNELKKIRVTGGLKRNRVKEKLEQPLLIVCIGSVN